MLERIDMPHLAARVFGTPLVISRTKLDAILHVLGPRLGLASPPPSAKGFEPKDRAGLEVTKDGIARIQVIGTLVGRAGGMDAASGMTSYSQLASEFENAMADDSVKGVLLEIDSPGGEASGVFDLVDRMSRAPKPCFAVANELAASGAYAIACAADRIYLPRTGAVGSVGVVALHVDQSAADRAEGLTYTYVIAGDKKVDGNPHEPLSPRAKNSIQEGVDRIYDLFVSTVANNRGMTLKAVRETQAGMFEGEQAVEAGLADQVGTIDDAMSGLRAEIKRRAKMDLTSKMAVSLGLSADATEAQVLAGFDSFVSEKATLSQRAESAEKKVADLDGSVAKLLAEKESAAVEHEIALAKAMAIGGGDVPLPKDVEDIARALFTAKRFDLAKQSLERHLASVNTKRHELRDPSAKTQKEATEADAKKQTLNDWTKGAEALLAAKNPRRSKAAK